MKGEEAFRLYEDNVMSLYKRGIIHPDVEADRFLRLKTMASYITGISCEGPSTVIYTYKCEWAELYAKLTAEEKIIPRFIINEGWKGHLKPPNVFLISAADERLQFRVEFNNPERSIDFAMASCFSIEFYTDTQKIVKAYQ